jgi:hypothetical protein
LVGEAKVKSGSLAAEVLILGSCIILESVGSDFLQVIDCWGVFVKSDLLFIFYYIIDCLCLVIYTQTQLYIYCKFLTFFKDPASQTFVIL